MDWMESNQQRAFLSWVIAAKFGGKARRLAEELEVNESTISKWRRGGGIEQANLERIAKLVGLSCDDALNRDWTRAVNAAPMFFQQHVSRTPTPFLTATPPELTQAIDWHVQSGADPRAVALAAKKAREQSPFDGTLDWLDWAGRIQDWLERIPVNKG